MSQLYTYDDAFSDVFGGGEKPDQGWDSAFNDVYGPKYVAGGPGGIPGAKDGLTPQTYAVDPWSLGYPGEAPESKIDPQTALAMFAFKQNVKAMGGNIDGKSDAEVLSLMKQYDQTGGNTISAYEPPPTTAADEFGRGLRRGVAYGLPLGIPGVEAMRENEQVQRAPEGVAGFAGETLGGFAGMLNPEQAPANALAIALTGGMGRAIAPVVGRVGEIAGPRVARAVQEAIINAGQGGGIAALQEAGRITPQEWAEDPAGSLLRVGKAAGIGAGAGGALGGGIGALGKAPVDYPAGTLPETLAPQTAADGRAAMAEQGRAAMRDVADVYRGAPRVNEIDPAALAARDAAEAQAMAQARASASAYDAEMTGASDIARRRAAASAAESAKIIENAPEPARVETPDNQIGANREEAQGQAQGNQEGLLSKGPLPSETPAATDWSTKSYAEIRARAKELGVLEGPKTRAALTERVKAAESNVGGSTPETAAPTPETKTRQPWEMTKAMADSAVFAADPRKGVASHIEDWGRMPRGQGKRIGGMVVGAMSDAPRGKKTYVDPVGAFNLTKDDKVDVGGLVGGQINVYSRSRVAGFGHTESMIYAETPNTGDRHRAVVEWALREGRPVPPEVLKDYPDLAKSAKPPTPAEPATTAAGTGAKPGESPKASVTDYPGKAPDTAPSEGIAGTAAKEAPEQPVPSTPTTSATAEPAVEPPASSPKTSSSGNAPEPTAQSAPESPRPERPASKDRQTSDDFTARRVVNKPEPGEPEGPVTAAKNEMTSAMREALNLQAFDSPERRTWQATLDTAVARGIPAKSLDIAAEVNLKPRVLAPEEEAGMTYRLVELSNEKRDIAGKLDGAKTDADRVALLASDERATQEIDAITTALNKGGTEAGRALNIRRMLLKDDYSLARVKLQIKKAEMAGAKFSPEQVKELESLAVRIEKASKDLESIAQKSLDQQAENTIKRHAASKRGLPAADRERVITELADSVRTLLSQGCR